MPGSSRPRRVRVVNRSRGVALAAEAEVADTFLARGRGLIGRSGWAASDGLVIIPCNSIHMLLMRFPIDVVYVDRAGVVCRQVAGLRPWRLGPLVLRSRYVVELPVGTLVRTGSQPGDQLALEPAGE